LLQVINLSPPFCLVAMLVFAFLHQDANLLCSFTSGLRDTRVSVPL
jgi:hypothetical protein